MRIGVLVRRGIFNEQMSFVHQPPCGLIESTPPEVVVDINVELSNGSGLLSAHVVVLHGLLQGIGTAGLMVWIEWEGGMLETGAGGASAHADAGGARLLLL